MVFGNLSVVKRWLDAVNHSDLSALLEVTADDIAIVGPRGIGHGKQLLAGWLRRAGFSARALRWFSGGHGAVVVEQLAEWSPSGEGRARVAAAFVVEGTRVARFERFDDVETALSAYGLRPSDEVTTHAA